MHLAWMVVEGVQALSHSCGGTSTIGLLLIAVMVLTVLAWLPALVARRRRHPQRLTLVVLTAVGIGMAVSALEVLVLEYGVELLAGNMSWHIVLIALAGGLPWTLVLYWSCRAGSVDCLPSS